MQNQNLQVFALSISNAKRELSKSQKEFNRLTLKITTLRDEIQAFEQTSINVSRKVSTDLIPLVKEFSIHQAAVVRLFDKAYETGDFKAKDKKKIDYLITTMAFQLISEHGMVDLKPIYDKYNKAGFDQENEDAQNESLEMAKSMAENVYGIEIEEDAELDTAEKFQEYMWRKMQEKEEKEEARRAERADERAKQPKTEKQRQREAKQQEKLDKESAEEKKLTQSVRAVYMDLVKTFHPDLEQNEEEKVRKTAIMQRVVSAYQDNDLTTLLQLQMEFERIDQAHLENIAEERLIQFNKVLSRQCKELSGSLLEIKDQIANLCQRSIRDIKTPAVLEYFLNTDIKNAKKEIKNIKSEIKDLENPNYMKAWIKSYQIPREDDFASMFSDFF
jgi:outer membrane biosynthesis protein TonB